MAETSTNNPNYNITGILFPGIVKNDERALKCLGGERVISEVHSEPAKRLGLSFHPENQFAKQTFANCTKACGILLKVRVKRKRTNTGKASEVVSTNVMGRVNIMYLFDSLIDFQYLPVEKDENNKLRCIIDDIVPKEMSEKWILQPAPSFFVPPNFTRLDKPLEYMYMDRRFREVSDADLIHSHRRSRTAPPSTVSFNMIDEFPSEAPKEVLELLEVRKKTNPQIVKEIEVVKKIFEGQPIWQKTALIYQTKISHQNIKLILPTMSNYHINGPWRSMWIRHGYDPRKDPSSRIYQSLDFRMRSAGGLNHCVQTGNKFNRHSKVNRATKKSTTDLVMSKPQEIVVAENTHIIKPDSIPIQRQTFYQYCNIKLPEVEAILNRLPEVLPGALCHPRRGWMPQGVDDQVRDILGSSVRDTLIKQHFTKDADSSFQDYEGSDDDLSGPDSDEDNQESVTLDQ